MALYFWNSCCLARSSRARAVTRSKGVPQLGAGAIYQVPETDIVVRDFAIPDHWPRGYGLDVGWKKTAAVWGALDRETGVIYLYSEHYAGMQQPSLHAEAIKSRGKWIPGVIDPASQGRTQTDGLQLIQFVVPRLRVGPGARHQCRRIGLVSGVAIDVRWQAQGVCLAGQLAIGVSHVPARQRGANR